MFDAAWEGKQIIEEALDAEGQLTPEELNQLLSVINRSVANIVKLQNKVYNTLISIYFPKICIYLVLNL